MANKKPTKAAIKAKKAKPIQTSTAADEPAMDSGLSEVIAAVSTGIDTIAATSATSPTAEAVLLTAIEKPVIKTEKILDDIPYDTQLPKEILQTEESPAISPYVEPSGASTYGKSADVTPVLPDDIFDTEESCGSGSVVSQTLSQPTPTHSVQSFAIVPPKCATAPTTPAHSPSSSPVIPALKSSTTATKRATKRKQTPSSGAATHEEAMTSRRKRLWIAIARKEIDSNKDGDKKDDNSAKKTDNDK